MVAAPWLLKMGGQVSQNLKSSVFIENSASKKSSVKKLDHKEKEFIGILSFEVANLLSKTIHLHNSLTDFEVHKLKNEVLKSEGVRKLVSCDDELYLLELVLAEKLEELDRVASVVSRLGKRCSQPALHGFEHVYGDLMNGVIDVRELGFLVKDMDGMMRKMERYVTATSSLYCELEALNELEQAVKKFQVTQNEDVRRSFEQKLNWQRQDVGRLRDASLWNQTHDKIIELLVRTICTIYARICVVFGEPVLKRAASGAFGGGSSVKKAECRQLSGQIVSAPLRRGLSRNNAYSSGFLEKPLEKKGMAIKHQADRKGELSFSQPEDFIFPCVTSPGRLFMDCLSLSGSAANLNDEDVTDQEDRSSHISGYCSVSELNRECSNHSICFSRYLGGIDLSRNRSQSKSDVISHASPFGPKSRLNVFAHPCTVGGSALALHYANIIIVIEKLLRYPHLVGEDARDDLYQMLPTSLRVSLKTSLKSYVKSLAIYDAPLAHDWKETVDNVLRWLTPMAHNMIRWQSERNFEQHQIGSRTNILLVQTLYFCDREKTEKAICELLVGLNYICRYEHQQNALLDCASSFDYDDFKEWQLQSSFLH